MTAIPIGLNLNEARAAPRAHLVDDRPELYMGLNDVHAVEAFRRMPNGLTRSTSERDMVRNGSGVCAA